MISLSLPGNPQVHDDPQSIDEIKFKIVTIL